MHYQTRHCLLHQTAHFAQHSVVLAAAGNGVAAAGGLTVAVDILFADVDALVAVAKMYCGTRRTGKEHDG